MESDFRTGLLILVVSVVTLVIGSIVLFLVAMKYAANKESEIKSKVESGDYTVYYNSAGTRTNTLPVIIPIYN